MPLSRGEGAMHVLPSTTVRATATGTWPAALAWVAAYAVWLVGWYWSTVVSMVSIWYRSETFVHGFLVLPIALWLVYRNRGEIAVFEPPLRLRAWPLVAIAGAAILWLMADLADVIAARHFAWISMLVAGIWLALGDAVARRLAFPLGFLYFAVPVGEFLLPALMDWTASFTVAALRLSGVPVLHEGNMIEIPTGSWSVVEACSGLRYIIASVMVGTLYGYLTYRSLPRRLAFVAASIAVPIVANWLRAYMIVMLGHLSGNTIAVGIDHIIYGWVFFGVVMALLFWFGTLWREDLAAPVPAATTRGAIRRVPRMTMPRSAALGAAFAIAAAAPASVHWFDSAGATRPPDVVAPVLGDWRPVAGTPSWTPGFMKPRAAIASEYERGSDRAGLYVAFYFDQDTASKLVSSSNQLVRTTSKAVHLVSERTAAVATPAGAVDARESVLGIHGRRLLARTWFFVDGRMTGSPVLAKLAQLRAQLTGRGDAGALVVVYGEVPAEGAPVSPALDDFTAAAAASLPGILSQRLRVADTR